MGGSLTVSIGNQVKRDNVAIYYLSQQLISDLWTMTLLTYNRRFCVQGTILCGQDVENRNEIIVWLGKIEEDVYGVL